MMNSEVLMQSVLIVDDQPENIRILTELLKDEYRIRVANSGEKAIHVALSDNPPDLILLDIVMPQINGYEVCESIKQVPAGRNIPIIFITSQSCEDDEVKGFEVGAVDYIRKPFNPTIVKARVRTQAELKRFRDMLEKTTYTDSLTNLPNRRKFEVDYETAWAFGLRDGKPLSIIMIDVDHFKEYNDHYGHIEGDECLKQIANSLKKGISRRTDSICRFGGEEFVCILPMTDNEQAVNIAQSMRQGVEDMKIVHECKTCSGYVTISLGVATIIPTQEQSSIELVHEADKMLYLAKDYGRNRVSKINL